MAFPNKYGYEPRSQEEADDLDREAEYWATHKESKGKCLLVLIGLVLSFGTIATGLFI